MTMNIFSLYVCVAIAYRYANKLGVNVLSGIIMSLTFYLELLPSEEGESGIALTYLGAQGMFVAIIAALLSVKIISVFEQKGLTIKLSEGLPQFVIDAFKIFISGTVIVLLGATISFLFAKTGYGSFPGFIYEIIQAPFVSVAGSLGGMILISAVSELFFFCGIYGTVISGLLMPIRMAATTANSEMLAAGLAHTEIWSFGSLDFISPGGAGSTLALAIIMFFFAKSKRYKDLSKVVIIPQICSINEPIIYGLPIILNPVMIIPFSTTTAINHIIYYFICTYGLMPIPYGAIAMGCPSPIIILMNGCGLLGIFWWLVILAVDACIYFPFFKVLDRQAVKDEQCKLEAAAE
jgi:PTS system cellobiose-specific IIC component